MERKTATEIIMLQKEKTRQKSLGYSIQILKEEREKVLNNMQLMGSGMGNVDYRPYQLDDLNRAIIILKKAISKKE